jgi:hypothetical protein
VSTIWTKAVQNDNNADVIDSYKDKIEQEVRKLEDWDAAWDVNADRSGQELFCEHVKTLLKAPKTTSSSSYATHSPIVSLQSKHLAQEAAQALKAEENKQRQGIRDKLTSLLQSAAQKLSPERGLAAINITQVATGWEGRECGAASATSKGISQYFNDFEVDLSVDLGMWLQEWERPMNSMMTA